eukprot:TRINITY_DN14313_c0_g1_i1.p1 TRINITY_DN14313_c0_g1~~TRINITY_DN14313_c0_g1_i1.p1  ORF type:complete len:576 (-),score=139.75 TRINITY_DN14313_c0_g1_i1:424-2151(-)
MRLTLQPAGAMSLLVVLLLLGAPQQATGALNIALDGSDSLVSALRKNIFVDAAYLTERETQQCSSLDGPQCFNFAAGLEDEPGVSHGSALDVIGGVIPERLLKAFGVQEGDDLDFQTPSYMNFRAFEEQVKLQLLMAKDSSENADLETQMLTLGDEQVAVLREARTPADKQSSHGVLSFNGLLADRRVPVTFSQGLPKRVVATWDGKWLARDCQRSSGGAGAVVAAGHSSSGAEDAESWELAEAATADVESSAVVDANALLPSSASALGQDGELVRQVEVGKDCSVVAELTSSLGYLRFSRPVVVRSLFARWTPGFDAPNAVINGRRGLQNIWATHLDPARLEGGDAWLDVSSGSLQLVDEVVFSATPGLEVGAVWITTAPTTLADETVGASDRADESEVLMLAPVHEPLSGHHGERPVQRFSLSVEKVSSASAPFVVSLQEALDRNLQLSGEPTKWAVPHSHGAAAHYPSLLSTATSGRWSEAALGNQRLLDHRPLLNLFDTNVKDLTTKEAQMFLRFILEKGNLPKDLHKALSKDAGSVAEATACRVLSAGQGEEASSTRRCLCRCPGRRTTA